MRTRRFVDVVTLRGLWRRINPSKVRTISIDIGKQQSVSSTVAGVGQHDERREEAAGHTTRGKEGAGGTMQGTTQVVDGF